MQSFHGEYKVTINGKCKNSESVKNKNKEYESNLYIDWIKNACENEINGKIKVEKISYNFLEEQK